MTECVILQRVVPHYRLDMFERLHREFGWLVVAADQPPAGTGLKTFTDLPFIRTFPFRFPLAHRPFCAVVPLGRILAELKPKAVLSEFAMQMSSTYQLAAMRRLGLGPRTMFWSHGYSMERGFGSPAVDLYQRLRARVAAQVDGHVCYNHEGKAFLDRHMEPSRVFVVRNTIGLPVRPLPPPSRPGAGFVFSGRFTQEKDIVRLVRIFRRLLEGVPDARLTIVGDGPARGEAEAAAGRHLGEGIRFVGAVYDEAVMAGLFAEADAAVFAGAVGLSVNHALSYGVPVIAFPRTASGPGHYPEITHVLHGANGLLADGTSDEAMVETLRGFIARLDHYRDILRAGAAAYARANFSGDVTVADFRAVADYLGLSHG